MIIERPMKSITTTNAGEPLANRGLSNRYERTRWRRSEIKGCSGSGYPEISAPGPSYAVSIPLAKKKAESFCCLRHQIALGQRVIAKDQRTKT